MFSIDSRPIQIYGFSLFVSRGILDLPLASWDPPRSACVSARLALQQVQNTRFTSLTPSGILCSRSKILDLRARYHPGYLWLRKSSLVTRTNGSVTAELRTKGIRNRGIHPKYFSKYTLATHKQPCDAGPTGALQRGYYLWLRISSLMTRSEQELQRSCVKL